MTDDHATHDVWLSESDVAAVYGIPRGTLRRWVHVGCVCRHPITGYLALDDVDEKRDGYRRRGGG